ncbi:MAG: hypothetical protein PUF51_02150 [Bifidobacteriaceae bacterium]|nr:hypothetical protein [Bifidobacteriaceae bacterium]
MGVWLREKGTTMDRTTLVLVLLPVEFIVVGILLFLSHRAKRRGDEGQCQALWKVGTVVIVVLSAIIIFESE